MNRTFPYLCILLAFSFINLETTLAQAKNIGMIKSWKKTDCGLEGKTEYAYFRIQVYDSHIIRTRVSLKGDMDDFSYVLTLHKKDDSKSFSINDEGGSVYLRTDAIEMEIEKRPAFRVIFRNRKGVIINEDVPGQGFGTAFSGNKPTVYKKMHEGERFVGLGEALGDLDRRGSAVTLNNTDTYRYGDPRLPMYLSVPFYIGIHDGEVYGIFFNNTWKTFFNFGISTPGFTSVTADGGDADHFFIYGTSTAEIIEHYTLLTGRMPLPPLWSLGYHQSRCSYFPQENVRLLAEAFRSRKIPVDCIVLDADYLKDYEPFRINTHRFPDMKGLTDYLRGLDLEVTASVNPGIKVDTTYFAHGEGLSKDVFVRYTDGSLYTAEIAPSLNNFIDFTRPAAREWWIENMKFLPENGIHGYWNDMNEPAVGGSYLPDNLYFDFDGYGAGAGEAKNLYGMLMARSSYESGIRYGKNRRPFVLTRSGFAGVQRYAAVWTGDNTASDEYLLGGALLNAQLGLSGIPFAGDDIGGYIGNTSRELFTRWIEVGVFEPFARNHKEAFALANEPWSYGEEAESIAREYIGFRYRLMPYLYSKFYESSVSGMPIARSLCISYPFDDKVYDKLYQYQFQCGDALLVVPVTSSEKTKKFYLPAGEWYDIYTNQMFTGSREYSRECRIDEIPVFVKGSSVIPMHSLVQSTKADPGDTLFIHLYNGIDSCTFEYYEDDGKTFDYQNGIYLSRSIVFEPREKMMVLAAPSGQFYSRYRIIKCILHGFERNMNSVSVNGQPVELEKSSARIIDGLRFLNDIYDPGFYKDLRESEPVPAVLTFSFPDSREEITIKWN